MSEHILANIDFATNDAAQNLPNKLSLQLSALAFSIGTCDDTAIINYTPDDLFLKRVYKLNLPTQKFIIWDQIRQHTVINPWLKTTELFETCEKKQLILKHPLCANEAELGSKAYAYKLCPPPFDSTLVSSREEAFEFLKTRSGKYVIKTSQGQSGRGHFFIETSSYLKIDELPIIDYKNARIEIWKERVLDFSSQWLFDKKLSLLGLCEILNNSKGGYKGSIFPLEHKEFSFFFKHHISIVTPLLQKIFDEGFRGHLGVDAFIYKNKSTFELCPLIEINPRKTMGYVALNLAKHLNSACMIQVASETAENSILPNKIILPDKTLILKSNLNLTRL